MTVAFPWAGRDSNGLVPMSGRAAIPFTPAGSGFNWPSMVGRVSGYIRPLGLRGLGQTNIDVIGTDIGTMTGTDIAAQAAGSLSMPTPVANSNAASGAPWYANLLGTAITTGLKVGSQISSYELNPLYGKSTFYQTPQGAIYYSNVPSTSGGIPGLTTAGSSLLPILLIGGVALFMMSRR